MSANHPTDHFSRQAATYARHRPQYPPALFKRVAAICGRDGIVWDCATGNGQAAVGLAPHVRYVIATDLSAQQLAQATPHPHVGYAVATAEAPPLKDRCVDLVTVAQALHWFDHTRFNEAVRRVVRPGGHVATWAYAKHVSADGDAALDRVIDRYYADVVGQYWPPERGHFDTEYRSIPWPWTDSTRATFFMEVTWTMAHQWGYWGSWSATMRYRDAHGGADPREHVRAELAAAWGDPDRERRFLFPMWLLVGQVG